MSSRFYIQGITCMMSRKVLLTVFINQINSFYKSQWFVTMKLISLINYCSQKTRLVTWMSSLKKFQSILGWSGSFWPDHWALSKQILTPSSTGISVTWGSRYFRCSMSGREWRVATTNRLLAAIKDAELKELMKTLKEKGFIVSSLRGTYNIVKLNNNIIIMTLCSSLFTIVWW